MVGHKLILSVQVGRKHREAVHLFMTTSASNHPPATYKHHNFPGVLPSQPYRGKSNSGSEELNPKDPLLMMYLDGLF